MIEASIKTIPKSPEISDFLGYVGLIWRGFLLPPHHNESVWSFVCRAYTKKKHLHTAFQEDFFIVETIYLLEYAWLHFMYEIRYEAML